MKTSEKKESGDIRSGELKEIENIWLEKNM